jgi:hypothetical protein
MSDGWLAMNWRLPSISGHLLLFHIDAIVIVATSFSWLNLGSHGSAGTLAASQNTWACSKVPPETSEVSLEANQISPEDR